MILQIQIQIEDSPSPLHRDKWEKALRGIHFPCLQRNLDPGRIGQWKDGTGYKIGVQGQTRFNWEYTTLQSQTWIERMQTNQRCLLQQDLFPGSAIHIYTVSVCTSGKAWSWHLPNGCDSCWPAWEQWRRNLHENPEGIPRSQEKRLSGDFVSGCAGWRKTVELGTLSLMRYWQRWDSADQKHMNAFI